MTSIIDRASQVDIRLLDAPPPICPKKNTLLEKAPTVAKAART